MECVPVDFDRFAEMLTKVKRGECCLLTCTQPTALQTGVGSDPPKPILCLDHLNNPDDTHVGKWGPTANPYYDKWSCCGRDYKKVVCNRLADAFLPYHLEIPITSEQVADFQARVERQRAETEYWERLIAAQNAGCDEAYDR